MGFHDEAERAADPLTGPFRGVPVSHALGQQTKPEIAERPLNAAVATAARRRHTRGLSPLSALGLVDGAGRHRRSSLSRKRNAREGVNPVRIARSRKGRCSDSLW